MKENMNTIKPCITPSSPKNTCIYTLLKVIANRVVLELLLNTSSGPLTTSESLFKRLGATMKNTWTVPDAKWAPQCRGQPASGNLKTAVGAFGHMGREGPSNMWVLDHEGHC